VESHGSQGGAKHGAVGVIIPAYETPEIYPSLLSSLSPVRGNPAYQAQENGEQETRTWAAVSDHTDYLFSNGKAWRALDAKSKITELEGIEQGMMMLVRETYPRLSPADRALLDEEPLKLMVKGFRMSDVAEQLDAYYKDSSNLRVPIAEAYKYSILKMRGARQRSWTISPRACGPSTIVSVAGAVKPPNRVRLGVSALCEL